MNNKQKNILEENLKMASTEAAHRPNFYRVLLDSTVYVLGTSGLKDGELVLQSGSEISLAHWEKQDGSPIIPFFSSLDILKQSIESEQSYLQLPAKALFEMTLGNHLILNPKSSYGKEFFPSEIQHLLADGVNHKSVQRTTQTETEVLLGQPAVYPSHMIASLKILLAKHQNVKRAFLALMHDTSNDEKPSLVIGIDASGDIDLVFREAGTVLSDTAPNGIAVDLYRIVENDTGLSTYFLKTTPFYEQKRNSKLRSFFSFGKKT